MSKKTLLKETTIRRFWKLANLRHINEGGIDYMQEDEELEELKMKRDDNLEEQEENLEDQGLPEPALDEPPAEEVPEEGGGEIEAEVTVPEEDVASLESAVRVLQDILDAAGVGEEEEAVEELPPEPEEEPALGPEAPGGEELMEIEVDDDRLEEVISSITDRVTKRILKEALFNKIKK